MNLNIALQMDPPHAIDIDGDSSFILGIEAQKRGYQLYYYHPKDLSFHTKSGSFAPMQKLEFSHNVKNPAILGEPHNRNLNEMQVILMRQDPPFDMGYITAAHLLEYAGDKTLIVNNPEAVRNAPEKLWVNHFRQFMPETLISRNLKEIQKFHAEMQEIIVKPLYGNGGFGVFFCGKDDPNLTALVELFAHIDNLPVIAQQYLPQVNKGDKRIILIDGEIGGAIDRIPQKGQIRSNLHVGGKPQKTILTKKEHEICEALKPHLKAQGLIFAGIDVIDNHLTEINITSPTGIQEINHFEGGALEARIWDAIEARL